MTLPAQIGYGVVTWTAVSAVADSADADALPDAVPVTGTLTFTPSATVLLAAAVPVTVIATPVTYTLDNSGVLRDSQGRTGITLVATDSPGVTPTGWTWTVAYKLNNGLSRGSFSFALPTGTTVDLTTVAPVSASNGAAIVQGPAGPGVPAGGTSGQVLSKASSTDYDTTWATVSGGTGGAVDSVNGKTGAVTLSATDVGADASGAASTAQAYAIQRAHHTGTQPASTVTGLATVATSGSYTDLSSKPTIPTVGAAGAGAAVALSSTDATVTNARTPTSHASTHAAAGADPITVAASQVTGLGSAALQPTSAFDAAGAAAAVLPAQTGNSGKFLTTNGTAVSWAVAGSGGTSVVDNGDGTATA